MAREQIERAIASIDDDEDRAETVHSVRKRCTKLRALIDLAGSSFADAEQERAAFRDIARSLSSFRDASILYETCDRLVGRHDAQCKRAAFAEVGERLAAEAAEKFEDGRLEGVLSACREAFLEAGKRSRKWSLEQDGWDALGGGMLHTCVKIGKAAEAMKAEPTAEAHHRLRKRVRIHWCHVRLLRPIAPKRMGARAELAKNAADLLGDQRDLAGFEARIAADPGLFASTEALQAALVLARRNRIMLEEKSQRALSKLIADEPADLAEEWGTLWHEWHEGRSRPK